MDQVRRRKRLFDNPVANNKIENESEISLTFLIGDNVVSSDGNVYLQEHLHPTIISDHFVLNNTVTTQRERKGK